MLAYESLLEQHMILKTGRCGLYTLSLGMVSQGVSARQVRAQVLTPWSGSRVAPALPCCYHCFLDLVSGLCWATSPNQFLEAGNLFYVLAQKFLVFS